MLRLLDKDAEHKVRVSDKNKTVDFGATIKAPPAGDIAIMERHRDAYFKDGNDDDLEKLIDKIKTFTVSFDDYPDMTVAEVIEKMPLTPVLLLSASITNLGHLGPEEEKN